jgi:long-chain acyl-CoA synthetase
VIAEQACFMYSLVTVPLYDTLGAEAIEFIVNQAELKIITATKDKAKIIIKLKPKLPTVEHLIIMDGADADLISSGTAAGIKVVSFLQVEQEGSASLADPVPPTGETIATICYTSGTTGNPKGVVLCHTNMIAFAAAERSLSKNKRFPGINKSDVHISYLPLAVRTSPTSFFF